ncbi:MAG: choice-of-anchor A family protein [Solirubrobacteraceae bacterium]
MPRWVVVCVLAALAALPSRALAADCAAPGVPGQYQIFALNTFTANTGGTQIPGRVAAGGNVHIGSITIGTQPPLTPDMSRTDLAVGGNLTVDSSGGQVPKGRVTYAGTLAASGTLTTYGGLVPGATGIDFAKEFKRLRDLSAQWAKITPNGTASGNADNYVLTGTSTTRNVFSLTRSQLQGIRNITVKVPASSTTLINVEGKFDGGVNSLKLEGPPPERVLWNFTTNESVTVQEWKGSILAPDAAFTIPYGQVDGSVAARDVTLQSPGWTYHPFSGCLPPLPPPEPQRNISLRSLCTDPLTKRHALVLTNNDPTGYLVHWEDTGSGLSDTLTAPANKDTFFDIPEGDTPHHIVATSGPTTVETTTGVNECGGSIVVSKAVTGEGMPPTGPWVIVVKGGNSFKQTVSLVAGAQATVDVPGRYQPGSVGIGQIAGGYDYTITEPAPLGARASVDPTLVTVTNEQPPHTVAVTNQYDAGPPEPPEPGPEPGPEPPVPPQPPLPPGPPQPLPGPDLVLAASVAGGADLAVSERISPRISQVGHVVSVTVRVRNLGPLPADGAVVREIPQVEPRHPDQVAQILGVTPTIRATSPCTSTRPVRCGPVTLAVGAEAVVRVRARMLRAGAFQSVTVASSLTPDTNTTNNASVSGVVVRRPSRVAVAVHAPAVARVGEPVSYRVVARGTGSDGAVSVRFCHRPPARLLMTSAPGTFRYRGRVCRDVSRLARGQQASFVVNAIPASSAGGRTLALRATASAPDARTAVGRDRIAVIAQSFVGTG